MAQPAPSRETSKRETREALILAGLAEFAAHGLSRPSLDAICARAGYTRGAFYVHFRDREQFISAVMERALGAFLDAVIATGDREHDLEQTVHRYTGVLAGVLAGEGHPLLVDGTPVSEGRIQLHRLLDACQRSPGIRERFASLLREAIVRVSRTIGEGQQAGSVRDDVEAEQSATLLVVLALGALTALEVGVDLDPARAGEAVLQLLRGRSGGGAGSTAAPDDR